LTKPLESALISLTSGFWLGAVLCVMDEVLLCTEWLPPPLVELVRDTVPIGARIPLTDASCRATVFALLSPSVLGSHWVGKLASNIGDCV
jgi:hypothetical protein